MKFTSRILVGLVAFGGLGELRQGIGSLPAPWGAAEPKEEGKRVATVAVARGNRGVC